MRKYNAVILGGGRSPISENLPKGNTPFNGCPLAGIAYTAVINSYDFNKIALVMNPDEKINLRNQDKFVEPTFCKSSLLSIYKGVKAIDDGLSDFVIVAGDLPFLDAITVKDFMQQLSYNPNVDVLFPLIRKEINKKRFPHRNRTYQPLQEGDFLPSSILYLSQKAIRQNEYLAEEIISSYPQKKLRVVLKLIGFLGLKSILRLHHQKLPLLEYLPNLYGYDKLFPKFSIKELEEKASEFTGVNVKLIEFPYPQSAFDIDSLEQLKSAKELNKTKIGSLEGILDSATNP